MKVVSQLNVAVDNVPGQLAKVAGALADAGVSIEGLSCTEVGVQATWHIVVDKTDTAQEALKAAGYRPSSQEIFAFVCPSDRPGVIASIAKACAGAGVNIGNIYTASTGSGQPAMVFMWVDKKDFAKAKEACGKVM